HRQPEHEQNVAEDAPANRGLDDFGEPRAERDEHDNQLSGVAESRIEKAADTGSKVLCNLFGRSANQASEWEDSKRRRNKDQNLIGVDKLEDKADWEEDEEHIQPATSK